MAGNWSNEEMCTLIHIWREESIIIKLDKTHQNDDIFDRIRCKMSEIDYEKSWQQPESKLIKLKTLHRGKYKLTVSIDISQAGQ